MIISRHIKDTDDPVLNALYEGVKMAREMATKASSVTHLVLKENKNEADVTRSRGMLGSI